MKQILLRVPDELHRRISERARRDNRSVNAVASELIDLGADADRGGRRERLRLRAAAVGLATPTSEPAQPVDRDTTLAATRGWGLLAQDLIRGERERL